MKHVYDELIQKFKKDSTDTDLELLLSILLYLTKDKLVVSDEYRPFIFLQNKEHVQFCINCIVKDLQLTEEQFLQTFSLEGDIEEDIWVIFPGIADYIYDLIKDAQREEDIFYRGEYAEKIKRYTKMMHQLQIS